MRRHAWMAIAGVGLAAVAAAAPSALKTTELGRGPTLVLLHGMGGARSTWMPTAKKLLGSYRVVLADLPGHGGSALPEPFSLDAAAEQVAATLAGFPAESTVVVGQGIGGVVALKALAAHPDRARGLVLIDAGLVNSIQVPDQQRPAYLSFVDQTYDNFLQSTFGRMGRDSLQGVQIHAQAAQVPKTTIMAYLAELLSLDATKDIKRVRLPVLALATDRAWAAGKDSAAVAKQLGYEGATTLTLERIPNAGLLVASERPDTLAAILTGFARRALARK